MLPQQFLLEKWWLSKELQKSTNIWATFERKYVTKNFQKSPNLVTLFLINEMLTFIIPGCLGKYSETSYVLLLGLKATNGFLVCKFRSNYFSYSNLRLAFHWKSCLQNAISVFHWKCVAYT